MPGAGSETGPSDRALESAYQQTGLEKTEDADKLKDPDVIAKKKRGIQYCEVASRWGRANGYKQWRYLFIPSKQVMPNSSFMQLAKRFRE